MSAAAAILTALAQLRGTLDMAQALVRAGRRVDLAGLDAEAWRVCAAIAALPLDAARPLRAELETTLRSLDRLAAALAQAG
ncbi:MAG TPA: hypothetical protein VE684_04960 [Crenalkalicoccus sp.]|nr:hypothetical protein [Crenalkalicoccus sp.]